MVALPRFVLLLVFGALLDVAPSAAQAPLPFDGVSWVGYDTGTSAFPGNPDIDEATPQAIASADFDGDGDADLAVATYNALAPGDPRGSSGFDILFNQGDGTFGEPVHYLHTTKGAFDIVVGDFNGDGNPDLALPNSGPITNQRGNTVVLFLNDGTGAFGMAGEFTVGEQPEGLAAGDFNADGTLDLVADSYRFDSEYVAVLLGTGTGSFAPRRLVFVGRTPEDPVAADFDGDSYDDIAVSALGDLTLLMNDGAGGFGGPVNLSGPDSREPVVSDLTAADLDGDGFVDLVHSVYAPVFNRFSDLAVRLGNGDGTFAAPAYYDLGELTLDGVEPVDLDGDGDLDLALANASGRTGDGILTLTNDGAGGFTLGVHIAAGQTTIALTAADLDGDGDADIATADRSSLAVTVHANPGDGAFPALALFPNGIDGNSRLDAGDVDGDGDLDVITSNEVVGGPASLVKNNGNGTFAPGVIYDHAPGEINRGPARAKLRDLDGDGDLDLLYNDAHTEQETGYDFWTGLNDGTGVFGPLIERDLNTCGNGDVDAFDLDLDGDLDVVNLEELNCVGSNFGNRLFISLNNGDATFQPAFTEQITAAPRDLAGGDLNGDGIPDLVTAHWGPTGIRNILNVHIGNGDGTFEEEQVYAVGFGPLDLVVEDLDGDGSLDIASANSGSDDLFSKQETMSVLWGDGTGAFTPAETYYAPYSPDLFGATGIAAGDVDGDGDLDLMMTTVANGAMLYVNDGARGFASPYRLGLTWSPFDPFFADFTGDGRPDLLTLGRFAAGGNGIGFLRGLSGQPSAPVAVNAAPVNPPLIVPADGGSFQFTVTLTNTTGQVQAFQAWTEATGPANRNPVLAPRTVTLPAGATVTRTLTQQVPAAAPAGAYTYTVNVGTFGEVVSASTSFPVEKEGTGIGLPRSGGEASGWSVSGWDEAAASRSSALPEGFALSAAYPNPFSHRAQVMLEVAEAQAVRVEIYDALGRRVAVLHDGVLAAGENHTFTLKAEELPSGVYVVRASGEVFSATRRVTILR